MHLVGSVLQDYIIKGLNTCWADLNVPENKILHIRSQLNITLI